MQADPHAHLAAALTMDDAANELRIGRATLDRLIAGKKFAAPDIKLSKKLVRYSKPHFLAAVAALTTTEEAATK